MDTNVKDLRGSLCVTMTTSCWATTAVHGAKTGVRSIHRPPCQIAQARSNGFPILLLSIDAAAHLQCRMLIASSLIIAHSAESPKHPH